MTGGWPLCCGVGPRLRGGFAGDAGDSSGGAGDSAGARGIRVGARGFEGWRGVPV